MSLNLISVFMRWLRQILRIGLMKESPGEGLLDREEVEITPSPVERFKETLEPGEPEEKPANIPALEEKTIEPIQCEEEAVQEETEGGAGAQEISIEIVQPEEKPIDFSEHEEKTTEPTQIQEEASGEEEDTVGPQRPYGKKSPTKERKGEPIRPPDIKKKPSTPEKREPIFLGDLMKRRRRLTEGRKESQKGEDAERGVTEKRLEEERVSTVIESPFVEIDLDNANVRLILPQQELKSGLSAKSLLRYAVDLNGKSIDIPVGIMTGRDGHLFTEEKTILLEEPLVKFQVTFPGELQARKYDYSHMDSEVYPFIAIGNNRGRFYYLNDGDGNVNPLPGREMWILLQEDFELQTEPEVTEEKWIWEKYQPFRVNLKEIDRLIIKNRKTGKQKKLFSESTFCVEGEELIEDDFKRECPLFTGKVLRIFAPHENQSGWNVWILHRQVGARIVCKDWTGSDCLTLRLPEDLPCEFGEFQIDICQGNIRVPEETLFFRLMPPVELGYPTALVIPEPKRGHTPSVVSIKIDSDDEWKVKHKGGEDFESTGRNFYQVEVSPEKDTARFSVAISGRPESAVNFKITVPRLKWKTLNQEEWQSKSQRIDRKDLQSGEPFYFLVRTNDFENKYDILAVLEANGRKVQEGKFVPKGVEHWLELNEFFDTIRQNKTELALRIEVRKAKESGLLGSIDVVHFEAETKISPKVARPRPREESRKVPPPQALVRCRGKVSEKRGKGFSREEIIGAGMNLRDIHLFNFPYDSRRKSSHTRNINALKILKERKIIAGGDEHAA